MVDVEAQYPRRVCELGEVRGDRAMVSSNVATGRHHGAPKHGDTLLAGLIRCKRCGRKLTGRYTGMKHHIPRYSCDAADPANRLVASELEARWNRALAHAAEVEGKIAMHDAATPAPIADPASLGVLASNLKTVWDAPTTDARLKKRIVRTLVHEVVADIDE